MFRSQQDMPFGGAVTTHDSAGSFEVAVLGAGLAGASTAWELARRGVSTVLVEAHRPGHRQGSSHGSSQIFTRACADPFYADLAAQAEARWEALEAESGTQLRHRAGALDFGLRRNPVRLAGMLGAAGVPHELLAAGAAAERWPHLRFDEGPVLYHRDAGWLDPDATVAACVSRAVAHGADLRTGVRVTSLERLPSGRVRLRGPGLDGTPVQAERVVVAAGPWLPELGLALRLPPLTVTQHQVFHFRRREERVGGPGGGTADSAASTSTASTASALDASDWPVFVHRGTSQQVIGLPSGTDGGAGGSTDGVPGAFKLSLLDDGRVTTASTRSGVVDPASRQDVSDYVRHRLPWLDPRPFAEATSLRTSTPTGDFVLDRSGPLVVVSPCSGHGGRFTPLIGRLAADLALGRTETPARFALPVSRVPQYQP
jgi:glycine/D-amino acid oxidase-like deaminating enzyme